VRKALSYEEQTPEDYRILGRLRPYIYMQYVRFWGSRIWLLVPAAVLGQNLLHLSHPPLLNLCNQLVALQTSLVVLHTTAFLVDVFVINC